MIIDNFNHTIDTWIGELDKYNFTQLCYKPSALSWSLGQVYNHIIGQSDYYLGQIKICLEDDSNSSGEMSAHGKAMFQNNGFPDELIEGPPSNADTPQPAGKESLLHELVYLRQEYNKAALRIAKNKSIGKTMHPGLHYFSASEWLQFADMHMRHHLRQKKRIDALLSQQRFL